MAFGIDDAVAAVASIGGKLIDRLWPDPAQAAAAKLELLKMQQSGELAKLAADTDLAKGQLAVNAAEAGSGSVFVAGWRPAVGWSCATGVFVQFVAAPLIEGISGQLGHPVKIPPLDMGTLMMLLGGMLGIGTMRTAEKIKGVAQGH
jgi:hypothetical protein